MTARYRRVPSTNTDEEREEVENKERAERVEKIHSKVHAFLWVVVMLIIFFITDVPGTLRDGNLNWFALNLAIVCFSAMIGIFFYLIIFIEFFIFKIYCY